MKTIKTAVINYYADTGSWPACHYISSSATPLLQNPGVPGWDGPYLQKVGMSPMAKPSGTSGCPRFGYYYVWWNRASSGTYSCYFDINGDGTYEIQDGISVSVYGLASAQEILKLDEVFDGASYLGLRGSMNTLFPSCGGLGLATLYIGRTGVPQ